MLSNLMEIYAEYSNQYMIYGKKIGSTIEKVVQLTVKDSSKLFELANKDYIEKVSEATNLPEGTYFHVNEVLSGFTKLKQMEKQIDNILSKNE